MTAKDEALRLALEALKPFSTPNWAGTGVDEANEAITAIKEVLAAPVQEPVAWRWTNSKGWLTYGELPHDRFVSTPLYTTPPATQRPWVGLTDEECVADTDSQLCSKLPNCSSSNTFGFDSVVYLEDTDENMAYSIAQYMEQK